MCNQKEISRKPAQILQNITGTLPVSPLVAAVVLTSGYDTCEDVIPLEVLLDIAFRLQPDERSFCR